MKSPLHKRYTVDNNINATHNVLVAIVESGLDIHLVHLGTMGVYGYGTAGIKIPEGVSPEFASTPTMAARSSGILYPANRQRLPHDQDARSAPVRLLQQERPGEDHRSAPGHRLGRTRPRGHAQQDERLINRFDYDGDYGTVLNRFLMQAAIGYPLTVHGTGSQTAPSSTSRHGALHRGLAGQQPAAVGAKRVNILSR
ncbi:MAG: hypothetical protein U1E17_04935 [Geminicoccaceae bacterium]